ncbi:hypothetical protein ACFLQW_02725, partial [Candidatus Zixiibacteriota bacterium]
IKNTGKNIETIPVIFEIGTHGSEYSDSLEVILAPGDSGIAAFSDWFADITGTFQMQCVAVLPADNLKQNDSCQSIVSVIEDPLAPIIYAIDPDRGGNNGTIAVNIGGINFVNGAKLSLIALGYEDIVIDSSAILVASEDTIKAMFVIGDEEVGYRDVIITNPDGRIGRLSNGYMVESGYRNMWVEIVGPELIRVGRKATYFICYGNDGNVDIPYPYLGIGMPINERYDVITPWSLPPDSPPSDTINGDFTITLIDLPLITGGSSDYVEVNIYPTTADGTTELCAGIGDDAKSYFESEVSAPDEVWDVIIPFPPENTNVRLLGEMEISLDNEDFPPEWPKDDPNIPPGYVMRWDADPNGNGQSHIAKSIGKNPVSGKTEFIHMYPAEGSDLRIDLVEDFMSNERFLPARRPFNGTNAELIAHGEVVRARALAVHAQWGGEGKNKHTSHPCGTEVSPEFLQTSCTGLFNIVEPEFVWDKSYYTAEQVYDGIAAPNRWDRDINPLLGKIEGSGILNKCWGMFFALLQHKRLQIRKAESSDPNGKYGPLGTGDSKFTKHNALYNYLVKFENDSSATIFSDTIWIQDTLSEHLDWSSLEFGEVYPGDGPDSIRPDFWYEVDFDDVEGVITWSLYDINLPPDTFPYWGEGWVNYSVWPKPDLPTGTRIENIAAIKFDVNNWIFAPMDSIPIFNTIDAGAPTSTVLELPETVPNNAFEVCWEADDDSAGSGINRVEVYVSEDGFDYQLWLTGDSSLCSTYVGNWGSTYEFYSVASDNVGHGEEMPLMPESDASTTVTSCDCTDFCDLDGASGFSPLDVSYIVNYVYLGLDARPALPICPGKNGDWNCDGSVDPLDVVFYVVYVYKSVGDGPCDPCLCDWYPDLCP